jgi:regulator of cell morphogenesis and NO signaling
MSTARTFTPDVTLADAARILPEAILVFEQTEIDYSCQGAKSLADAATEAGYRVDEVIGRLESQCSTGHRSTNWFQEPLPALMQFLANDHRRTLNKWIPQLRTAIENAVAAIGENAELRRIRILFAHITDALSSHVLNEERELFPFINHLDAANNDLSGAPRMRISQRVLRELVEHERFRDRLRTLRELAQRLPAHASVSAFRNDLNNFTGEVHRHMHLENNVLYPRAIEIENGLRRSAVTAVVD